MIQVFQGVAGEDEIEPPEFLFFFRAMFRQVVAVVVGEKGTANLRMSSTASSPWRSTCRRSKWVRGMLTPEPPLTMPA